MELAENRRAAAKTRLRAALRQSDIEGFRDVFEQAVADGIADAEILTMAAAVYCLLGEQERAWQLVGEAERLEPSYLTAQLIKAKVLLAQGKRTEAAALLENIMLTSWHLLTAAEQQELEALLAKVGWQGGKPSEELREYCRRQAASADEAELYELAADAYNKRQLIAAEVYIEELLPRHKAKYYFLGGLIYRLLNPPESYGRAIECFAAVKQLGQQELSSQDWLKCLASLRTLYWEVGAAELAYVNALEAYEFASEPAQRRFDLSSALFIAVHLDSLSAAELAALHRLYNDELADLAISRPEIKMHQRIRIGYISPDFRNHPVAHFIMGLFRHYTHELFEVYCYHNSAAADEVTAEIKAAASVWREVSELTDEQTAELIRRDEIDILVELAGHTSGNSLAVLAQKPAPVQLCGIGYVHSTGLTAVDYFLTDQYCTGEEQRQLFSEQPLRLAATHFCYTPSGGVPTCRHLPCSADRPLVFGCFNKAKKISNTLLACWRQILQAVPNSRLVLKAGEYKSSYGRWLMLQRLQSQSLPLERIELLEPSSDYMECYNQIDIALDTYPCNGGTTTFEALYMGVPVITLVGTRHVSRFGYSIMRNLEIDDWLARSEADYVAKAVRLAQDWHQLDYWHSKLRTCLQQSPLMDESGYTAAVEAKYLAVYYERWPVGERLRQFAALTAAGKRFMQSKRYQEARLCARMMCGIDAGNTAARLLLAGSQLKCGDYQAALKLAAEILQREPANLEAMLVMAYCYRDRLEYQQAADVLTKAYQQAADGEFRYAKSGEAASLLGALLIRLGRIEDGLALLEQGSELEKNKAQAICEYSNYLLAANYSGKLTAAELHDVHLGYNKFFAAVQRYEHELPRREKLRLGYVSADFRQHPVAYYAAVMLEEYDRSRFEVFCYQSGGGNDAVTERLRTSVDGWRSIDELSDEQAAQLIYEDKIDILIDLSGHTAKNRLGVFAYKPAPVQISGIGYFNTTGLAAMDYFISDIHCAAQGGQRYFSEKLLCLGHSHWCYTPIKAMPPVAEPPCLRSGRITFGVFNNFSKVTDKMLCIWQRILQAVSGSRLILKSQLFNSAEGAAAVKERLRKLGMELERIELRGFNNTYLQEYGDMDIALDTFPYQGGATTCEALYMGVPVITLAGERHGSRFGVSIMNNVGLAELVAADSEEYIAKAVSLAGDRAKLSCLRQQLRAKMQSSPLMNRRDYMAELEGAYQRAWSDYCAAAVFSWGDKIDKAVQAGKYTAALAYCGKMLPYAQAKLSKRYVAELLNRQARLYKEIGKGEAAAEKYDAAQQYADGELAEAFYCSQMLCCHYTEYDFVGLQELHSDVVQFQPSVTPYRHQVRQSDGKIRIGYISSDWRRHVMLNFISSFCRGYNRHDFTVYCYMTGAEDAYTAELAAGADGWRNLNGCTAAAAEVIYRDGLDILVDLNGFAAKTALDILSYRPAPIQLTGLGYIDFINLPYIDYCLADKTTLQCLPNSLRQKGLALPSGLFCYAPYQQAAISSLTPWQRHGYITFGSFNQLAKLNDAVLKVWSRIIKAVPQSKLVLKANAFADAEFVPQYKQYLSRFGLHNVELRPTNADYLAEYNDIDIALDTFPYNGGGTTCDALYMGVPVITLAGRAFGDNYGASILTGAGLAEFIGASQEEYVQLAVQLAQNPSELVSLKRNLRSYVQQSDLMNTSKYMAGLEAVYKRLYLEKRNGL